MGDNFSGVLGGITGNTFGIPAQELQDLTKALGTGQLVGGSLGDSYVDGGAPFRVQSLEGILKVVTFQDKNIVFWKDIPKQQAYNTTEEYNQLTSYGGGGSGFFKEGDLPKEDDSTYVRKAALVKFMGETGIVTHALTLVRSAHGDIIGREAKNRTMSLLKKVELALFTGDSTLDPYAWDGIESSMLSQGADSNVIDLRGAALDEETCEDIARIVADNYGQITTLYLGNQVLTDLVKQILPQGRFQMPFGDQDGRLGYRVRWFDAALYSFELKPNVFLVPGGAPKSTADTGAPAAPTIASAVAASDSGSLFTADAAGTAYKVSAVSNQGESLPSAATTVDVTAGDKVTVTINSVANATAYKIYRGATAATVKYVKTVAATVTTTVFVDLNADIPGTSKAYGVMLDEEQGLAFKQLAPLMKMDLATIAASYRFMVLLYGTPVVYAPKKMVVIKNIGSL